MEHALALAYPPDNVDAAIEIESAVASLYPDLPIQRLEINSCADMPGHVAAVAVLFDETFAREDCRTDWLTAFDTKRSTTPLLPIALSEKHGRPPSPISNLKSRFWPRDRAEVLTGVGASLGLSLRPGENKVFVSYRQVDGAKSANLVEAALRNRGFDTWMDEAQDIHKQPNLPIGEDVQKRIAENLSSASAMVLIDTPRAGESDWIDLEIEIAVGKMIPIFPIVLHDDSVETSVSRFRVLQSLHRRAVIESVYDNNDLVAPAGELDSVITQLERYLQSVYQNRVVQLRELESFLNSKSWSFSRNEHLPHLHSGKVEQTTRMLSLLACCSFEENVFAPRLREFVNDMTKLAQLRQMFNCNFYLYPGQTLREKDLLEILKREVPDLPNVGAELVSYNDAVARISLVSEGYDV